MQATFVIGWWTNVVRDHQKDDFKYLQGIISSVVHNVVEMRSIQQQLRQVTSSIAPSLNATAFSLCQDHEALLSQLRQREKPPLRAGGSTSSTDTTSATFSRRASSTVL
jgi:hypothetical protein